MDRNLCKEMVCYCRMASEAAILLSSLIRTQHSSHATKQNCSDYPFSILVSNDVFRPLVQSLTSIATSPPPQPCFVATSIVPLAPRQVLSKIATSPLAADSAKDALVYDDQPWAADSASAALGHGDYDCVAGPASAALLSVSCMAN